MDTPEISQIDERPVSTVRPKGFLVAHYHEMSDQDLSDALPRLTRTQVRVLTLAAQGANKKEICRTIGIRKTTLMNYLYANEPFHDAYYTIIAGTGFSANNTQRLALSKGISSVERLAEIAQMPIDWETTKPAMIAQSVSASKELLSLGGVYPKSAGDGGGTVNIGQLLVNLTQDDTPQWKR